MRLNTTTIRWPDRLEPAFEVTEGRVEENRGAGEKALTTRLKDFETLLDKYLSEMDVFTEKSDLLRADTISKNVEELELMVKNIDLARDEAEEISREEKFLEFDPTSFIPQIALIESTMQPYLLLWRTASQSPLDLIRAPYALYGVKYIDPVPLALCRPRPGSTRTTSG